MTGATGNAMRTISVVIPVFNEQANIRPAYDAVVEIFADLRSRYELELLYADNHSTDGTFDILKELARTDTRVKAIRYNRNYGFQRSILTAYRYASGDAAIQLDCDLQDPPSLIPEFLRLWEEGHDVVVGVRRTRTEGRLITWARKQFYFFLDAISEDNITRDAGDFRLVDRAILDALKEINDTAPYVRALTSSLAMDEAAVAYDRNARVRGQSKFPLRRLVSLGLDGVFGHSMIPLRLATYTGILVSIAALLLSVFYLVAALLYGSTWPSGFATTAILILFGIGVNGIFLGVIGEYIGRIYQQTRRRPLTVITQRLNMPTPER